MDFFSIGNINGIQGQADCSFKINSSHQLHFIYLNQSPSVLPFKDQKSANAVRHQLSDLSRKIDAVVQPVYVSKKIKGHFKPKEHKPPIVNQQNVVYHYKCGLCDTDYVGFTCRHLHQRVEEHKRSTIGYHVKDKHGGDPDSIGSNFEILKCRNKLDCLIFEMLFIRKLKPKLNKQSDSIRAKLFT